MKKLLLYFLVMAVFQIGSVGYSQDLPDCLPESVLPSHETSQSLGQLPSENLTPTVRRAPDEGGEANKETWLPLGDMDMSVILLMLLVSGFYLSVKTQKRRNI